MADIAHPAPPRTSPIGARELAVVAGAAGLVATFVVAREAPLAALSNFMVVFSALLIQAMPLVTLGALVAAAIAVFVPPSFFERLARLPEHLQLPAAGIAGFAFPVCECGSVPVARRLVARGLVPSAAVTFMLAAPILNPLVILSTSIAYRGRDILWPILLGRIGLGLIAAMAVGWVAGGRSREGFLKHVGSDVAQCGCGDESCADDAGHEHAHESRSRAFFGHVAGDFVYMGRFLVIGAAAAAALQTLVPQSVIGSVANTPLLDLLTMMALAFALSLCSESDAFVAASFVQFGVGAQLAFLVFGPMVDTKLGFLYSATFSKGFFRTVLAVVTVVTLVGTLWVEVLVG